MKKFLYIFVYVVFLTGISYVINGKSLIGVDDANIYMTYMRNFANGHGFVYNIGGERVEGFTSLLWTLIGALFYKLTIHVEILLSYHLRDVAVNRSYPIRQEWSIAVSGRNTSAEFNNFFSQTTLPSQGVLTAGGSAYGYKGETIDLLGLNNTKMAHASKYKDPHLFKNHASFDKNTFFDLAPDI